MLSPLRHPCTPKMLVIFPISFYHSKTFLKITACSVSGRSKLVPVLRPISPTLLTIIRFQRVSSRELAFSSLFSYWSPGSLFIFGKGNYFSSQNESCMRWIVNYSILRAAFSKARIDPCTPTLSYYRFRIVP